MEKITMYEDFLERYEQIYDEHLRNTPIRLGQFVFNYTHTLFPEQVNTIRGTENDCFYINSRIPAFFKALNNLIYNENTTR